MNDTAEDLTSVLADIQASCDKNGPSFIEAYFADREKAPSLIFEKDAFVGSVKAERPPAVYWYTDSFNFDEFVDFTLEPYDLYDEDDEDGESDKIKAIKLALHQPHFDEHEGKPYFLVLMFAKGGISHFCSLTAEWASSLSAAVREAAEDDKAGARGRRSAIHAENEASLEPIAKVIAADPAFLATRGLPKRYLFVAGQYMDRLPKHPFALMSSAIRHIPGADWNLERVTKMAQAIADINAALEARKKVDPN